jgi:hypothetical protein
MSDTTDPVAAAAPIPDPAPVPPEPQTEQAETDASEPEQQAETPEQQQQKAESESVRKRMASMVRKLADERRAKEAMQRERDAALALANAGKEPDPAQQREQDVETRAAQLLRDREAATKRQDLINTGAKEFGAEDWDQKTQALAAEGALGNAGFMDALLDMPPAEAAKMVAHFADDTDALGSLLGLSHAAIGRRMGQMAAELSKPAVRTISAAPKPVNPVNKTAVVAEPSVYDDKLSMAEFVKIRQKQAPRRLGGAGGR